MKVLVFGAGAIGSLLGAFLASRHEVTLVGRAPHVDAVRREGLRVEGIRTLHVHPAAKTAVDGTESPDVLLLTVKAHQTRDALRAFRPAVGAGTLLVTCQNGLGNYEALLEAFPDNAVLAATVTYGAMLPAPGRVVYAGAGEILLGGNARQLDSAGRVGRLLREAGFKALGVPEIRGVLWQKAIVNAAINPLTALTGRTNGELLLDPVLVERMRRVAAEGAAVARAQKIPLPERDPFAAAQRVAEATAENRSSMLRDLEQGRRTEIDAINGAIADAGRRLGIPTPENASLVEAVHARERAAGA